jgi:hypothetical protein
MSIVCSGGALFGGDSIAVPTLVSAMVKTESRYLLIANNCAGGKKST